MLNCTPLLQYFRQRDVENARFREFRISPQDLCLQRSSLILSLIRIITRNSAVLNNSIFHGVYPFVDFHVRNAFAPLQRNVENTNYPNYLIAKRFATSSRVKTIWLAATTYRCRDIENTYVEIFRNIDSSGTLSYRTYPHSPYISLEIKSRTGWSDSPARPCTRFVERFSKIIARFAWTFCICVDFAERVF